MNLSALVASAPRMHLKVGAGWLCAFGQSSAMLENLDSSFPHENVNLRSHSVVINGPC